MGPHVFIASGAEMPARDGTLRMDEGRVCLGGALLMRPERDQKGDRNGDDESPQWCRKHKVPCPPIETASISSCLVFPSLNAFRPILNPDTRSWVTSCSCAMVGAKITCQPLGLLVVVGNPSQFAAV